MIINNYKSTNLNSFDYVIIGGGPAGISLALNIDHKKRVLLIEAGDNNYSEESQDFYKGEVVGDKYWDLNKCRNRQFGGSSNLWSGMCFELDDIDFNSWPIKKEDLRPFENNAKKILNINGNFIKKKSDFKNFFDAEEKTSDVNFAKKYLQDIKNSQNIFLLLNSPLTEIIPEKKNLRKIKKIKVMLNHNQHKEIEVKKLILCAGGIENSRILLWSKLISKNSFLNNLKIGNYWMEHPSGQIGQMILNENQKYNYSYLRKLYLVPSNEFIKNNKINNMRINFKKWDKNENNPNFDPSYLKNLICIAPNLGKKIWESFNKKEPVHCFGSVDFSGEQKPEVENKIVLSSKKDLFGIPQAKLIWNIKEDFFYSLRIILEDIAKQFAEKDIGRIGIDRHVYDATFKDRNDFIFANYHHIGGTVMGNDIEKSVVDKNLKVHNTDNLYIAGSSVFSSGGHANPTYTIVLLSLKLAHYLNNLV